MNNSKYESKYKTPEQALQACLIIWKELARTGAHKKSEAYANLEMDEDDLNHCPACDFTSEDGERQDCTKCPIWENESPDSCACECDTESPYSLWMFCTGKELGQRAQSMVELIEAKLKELES